MKVIEIKFDVTPYRNSAETIAKLEALGAPASLLFAEDNRNHMVRESLPTRHVVEWASKLYGEFEYIYLLGKYSAETKRILDELVQRGIILAHKEAKI